MEIDDDTSKPKGNAQAFEHSFCLGFLFVSVTEITNFVMFEGEEEKGKPIIVILVGAPGSGKSTFCDQVMRLSTRPWVRVCQVSISLFLMGV